MKRNNIISGIAVSFMLLVGIISASATSGPKTLSGNSQTILGEYQITELEPETENNETMRKFQLDYENGVAPVTIYLSERRNCREYIVRSKVMEVQYVCNKKGFGATPVSSRNSLYPEQIGRASCRE